MTSSQGGSLEIIFMKCLKDNINKLQKFLKMPTVTYKQGYNDRLDESLGGKHKGHHSQSLKDRRDESKAMSKKIYGHAYGGDHGMKYEKAISHLRKLIRK